MDSAGVGTSTYSKAERTSLLPSSPTCRIPSDASLVQKQVKLEEQRKAAEQKNGTENDRVAREGEDRRKKGRVNRWINLALGSFGG
jgi:hypothetical protein